MPNDQHQATGSGGTHKAEGASWGAPLERLDEAWQRLESRLCAAVLVAEIVSLTLWIFLRGLSTDFSMENKDVSGIVARSLLSVAVLGTAAHLATRDKGEKKNRAAVTAAVVVGFLSGGAWAHVGVHYSSNLLNFLQNASALMLVNGLRGVATRLTLWLALLGASLATSRGKHIHVDVLVRYVPKAFRAPAALASLAAAALVSALAACGFVDYISIAEFRATASEVCPNDPNKQCDTSVGQKLATVKHEMAADAFMFGRQLSLDLKSWPRVLAGTPYDKWMTAAEWNAWMDEADWTAHYDKSAVDALHMDPSAPTATRMPQITVPGTGEEARGLIIRDLNFVFPFGLAVITVKFMLRILLVLSGHVNLDPEAELDDEELVHAHERDEEAAAEAAQ
jgi:hypothetical protein